MVNLPISSKGLYFIHEMRYGCTLGLNSIFNSGEMFATVCPFFNCGRIESAADANAGACCFNCQLRISSMGLEGPAMEIYLSAFTRCAATIAIREPSL